MYFIFISLLIYLFIHFFDKYNLQNDENAHLVTKVVFRIGMHCTDHLLLSVTVLGEMGKKQQQIKGTEKNILSFVGQIVVLFFLIRCQKSKIINYIFIQDKAKKHMIVTSYIWVIFSENVENKSSVIRKLGRD